MKPTIIAFYLPQYHPTMHNNEWWGEGFTEWTNVAKAKPLFWGHYQPKIPSVLGFYDLRLPEVRERQAVLAQEAGVSGFCYYHYWFGNGHEELELPFKAIVESKEPVFPFCLCWANESWGQKFWNKDGSIQSQKILVEQKYLGVEDDVKHFYSLLPAFKDERYMTCEGKLIFMIYKPLGFKGLDAFMNTWNDLAIQNGLPGFYFIGYTLNICEEYNSLIKLGFNAVCSCRMKRHQHKNINWFIRKSLSTITGIPDIYSYKKVFPTLIGKEEIEYTHVYPTLIPNWDHTPRSGAGGYLFHKSSPDLFKNHVVDVLNKISHKSQEHQICFLKSWNEWGEGNYMEPDLKYGKGYIEALRNSINECKDI